MISAHFLRIYWLVSIVILSLIMMFRYDGSRGASLLYKGKQNNFWTYTYALSFILLIGFRNVLDRGFGDTSNYRRVYLLFQDLGITPAESIADSEGEWVWDYTFASFAHYGIPVETFFLVVAIGYIGFMLWGVKRLFQNNEWIAWLFCVSSLSFLSYGVNGLRNGLACSMVILAITYFLQKDRRGLLIGLIISFLAIGIHKSVTLPVVCCLVSLYLMKSTRKAIAFWLFSIFISLLFGTQVQMFFSTLGFDDRMSSYAGMVVDEATNSENFSHTGFRFDFLLYSAMPILLGYIIVYKKAIRNLKYEQLLNTYILANAFWVMVIRANFSNRFAYLSWFLYPIVLAYPLLEFRFVKKQDRLTVRILLASVAFTLFMDLIYW